MPPHDETHDREPETLVKEPRPSAVYAGGGSTVRVGVGTLNEPDDPEDDDAVVIMNFVKDEQVWFESQARKLRDPHLFVGPARVLFTNAPWVMFDGKLKGV